MSFSYHPLRVAAVVQETPDARSLVFEVPAELAATFAYRPGQFLTVRVPHGDGGSVARCYSLSSCPYTDPCPQVTVKRVADGHASNWLCEHPSPGTVLDVLPPAGMFTPASLDDDLLLFAGGSGITPVISIVKAVLAEGRGRIALVYANRDRDSVIFAAELDRLRSARPERLRVVHWLDAEQGPPTVAGLRALARSYADREAFVCGPEPYMAAALTALEALEVPDGRVHVERFLSLVDNPFESAPAGQPEVVPEQQGATAEVTIDGQTHRLAWAPGTRLLDVLIDAGLNPPYSCRQGICGACACRKLAGEVDLVHNEVLEDEDFADGYILACQALPRSETVVVTYS